MVISAMKAIKEDITENEVVIQMRGGHIFEQRSFELILGDEKEPAIQRNGKRKAFQGERRASAKTQ